jgi:hypothetical protein
MGKLRELEIIHNRDMESNSRSPKKAPDQMIRGQEKM